MFNETLINTVLNEMLAGQIEKSLEIAGKYDNLEEHDAVMTFALGLIQSGAPQLILAVQVAALAIRWHRTQQTEAIVSSREPGPSPA
jgi:hypothetical protein